MHHAAMMHFVVCRRSVVQQRSVWRWIRSRVAKCVEEENVHGSAR